MASVKKKELCLYNATLLLIEKLERSKPLYITIDFIRSLHKEIYRYYRPAAGNFRSPVYGVKISSKTFKPVKVHLIRPKLLNLTIFMNDPKVRAAIYRNRITNKIPNYHDLNKKVRKVIYGLFCASYVHHQITTIHPFTGGNGRLARMLMCLELARHNMYQHFFPPYINHAILLHRDKYLEVLGKADNNDYFPFLFYLSDMYHYSVMNDKKLAERSGNILQRR